MQNSAAPLIISPTDDIGGSNEPLNIPPDDRFVPNTVIPLNSEIPKCFHAAIHNVYVRECYGVYYEYIHRVWGYGDLLTSVTGTPGIGKSFFYSYFFDRFRAENKDVTIVTASYNADRTFQSCLIFYPGSLTGCLSDKIPVLRDAVYLFDGAPNVPPANVRMVCFTSPNHHWLRSICKDELHTRLYMPVWTLEELLDAADALKLSVSLETIGERFNFFGGSARYCLKSEAHSKKVDLAIDETRQKIWKITSFEEVERALDQNIQTEEVNHQIFHCSPILLVDLPERRELFIASVEIRELLDQSLIHWDLVKQREFVRMLRSSDYSSSLLGWIFEAFSARTLKTGGEFAVTRLSSPLETCAIVLDPDQFKTMPRSNYPAVDGVFRDNGTGLIWLFQMTRAESHPLKGAGIKLLLKEIHELHALNHGRVRLVFVVPANRAEFPEQNIVVPDLSLRGASAVDMIPGIGRVSLHNIRKKSRISTADELRERMNTDSTLEVYRRRLDAFEESYRSPNYFDRIAEIPQFRLVMNEEF